ncbi:pilus assembly protein [Actinomadura geliboluensis]|uniref:Pilus assembly protein n=1 Tax=Actinomadura geliboluensis TaxID=882440 RepID=A0A5S4GKF1_9ACTN|nr:pilus assembly protein [Actinomadura geliboluensis]TMR33353.1 pilus assembly protein [Actinomadura geliboluensis]
MTRRNPIKELGRDTGSATVTAAIVFPAVGVLFLGLLQAVMVSVARDVALSSAEEGLRAARARHGTAADGRSAAISFARAEPVLRSPDVTVSGGTTITVQVSGSAPSILPGIDIAISRTARGARERFTTEQP